MSGTLASLPPLNVPLVDVATGQITPAWFRTLLAILQRTGGSQGVDSQAALDAATMAAFGEGDGAVASDDALGAAVNGAVAAAGAAQAAAQAAATGAVAAQALAGDAMTLSVLADWEPQAIDPFLAALALSDA